MKNFIPTIGEAGFYKLSPPFNIPDGLVYKCTGIRKISELTSGGEDVFALYYQPYGIDLETFEKDALDDIEIITLLGDGGHRLNVPSTYLLGYPNMNGIPYRHYGIVAKLPAFSVDQNFDHLKAAVENAVLSNMGTPCSVEVTVISKTMLIEKEDHDLLEAQRADVRTGTTPEERAAYWRGEYNKLRARHDALIAGLSL